MVTGLDPHHHGYLHWDATLDLALPTLFTVAAANGYTTGSFVFDESYLFKGFADANVAGTSETLDSVVERLRAHRSEPFVPLVPQLGDAHAVPHPPRRARGVARREGRDHRGHPVGRRRGACGAPRRTRAPVESASQTFLAGFLEALGSLGLREETALAFTSDHGESWGERFADKHAAKGTYHMHGATVYDEIVEVPLIVSAPGRIQPGVVSSQVNLVDLPDAPRPGGRASRRRGRRLARARSPR